MLVVPRYSKGEMGRKLVGLDATLRVYLLQQWFALSDPTAEDALYESAVLRRFAGVDLDRGLAPGKCLPRGFSYSADSSPSSS